jgi:hypothetical protein
MGAAGDQAPKFPQMPSGNRNSPSAPGTQGSGNAQNRDARIESAFEANKAQGFMLGAEVVRVSEGIQQTTSSVRIKGDERVVNCAVKKGTNQMADMQQQAVATMPLHLSLIELNDTALVGVSGEVVTNIYWHLKKTSPLANTIMLTIANDRLGYIADDASYDTPLFEVNGSPLARGCAENAIVNDLTDMIKQNE